jgi:hypothetical protein
MMKSRITVYALCVLATAASTDVVLAGRFDELLEAVARGGRHGNGVPNRRMFGPLDGMPKLELPQLPKDELLRRFNRLEGVDDTMRRRFLALPSRQQAGIIELGEAAQRIMRRHGDDGMDLLRKLDADGLVQVRTYGDSVLDGVVLLGPQYKSVVRKMGSGAGTFYENYIRLHKGKWAAGTLAAAYLAAPETFHDATGRLTKYGIEKLTEGGIIITTSVWEGLWDAWTPQFQEKPVFSTLGLLLLIGAGLLLVPRVRWLLFNRLLGPLWRAPADPEDRAAEIEKERGRLRALGLRPEEIETELRKKYGDYGGERKSPDTSRSALQDQPRRFEE